MQSENAGKKKGIAIVLILCFFAIVFFMVYNAELVPTFEDRIRATLMNKHKTNETVEINGVESTYKQEFVLNLSDVQDIRVRCKRKGYDSSATIHFELIDSDTKDVLAETDGKAHKLIGKKSKTVALSIDEGLNNLQNRNLILSIELFDAEKTRIIFTSNIKQGIVKATNNDINNKTNIVYNTYYGSKMWIASLYFVVIALIGLFILMCLYLFIIKERSIAETFIPLSIFLGIIMTLIFMPHGIPDEPGHIDTAYKYSDVILGSIDPGDGRIMKRKCDVIQDDMLVNGLESNSFYQLKENLFKKPTKAERELVPVSFENTAGIVPDMIYIPSALGISLGRIMGLSTLLTYFLGRMFNLIIYIIISTLAIKIIPYKKNAAAMVMLLPISVQQAASISYDAIINSVLLFYVAYALMIVDRDKVKISDIVILLLVSVFIVITKGGVYSPLCLTLLLLPYGLKKKKLGKKSIIAVVVALALVAILIIAEYPVFRNLLIDGTSRGKSELYTLKDIMNDPFNIVVLYWRTIISKGTTLLEGLLGGRLSWLDVRASWLFLVIIAILMILFSNIEYEKMPYRKNVSVFLGVIVLLVCILIFASMIVGFTVLESETIQGLQGRYFLPILPLAMVLAQTDAIRINREQVSKLSMVLLMTEAMIILESIPQMVG